MNRPAAVEITYGCMKFLITHNPTDATLNKFTEVRLRPPAFSRSHPRVSLLQFSLVGCQELKKFHVNTLVRVCDATYDKAPVEKEGIQVLVSADSSVSFVTSLDGFLDTRRFTIVSSRRTGLSMMAALLPLRLLTIGSSCSTPSSERNLAAASPCIVWQDLAGKCLAPSISIDTNKLCRNPLFLSLHLPLLINWQRSPVIVPGRAGVDINIPVVSSHFLFGSKA